VKLRSILLALFAAIFIWQPAAWSQTVPVKTLVLYDEPAQDNSFKKLGLSYAIMLRNLIGHFNSTVDLVPVQNYTPGKLNNYSATFYMGSYYDNPVPASFLADVNTNYKSTSPKTVVWFKYNLWQLAWNGAYQFTPTTGITFLDIKGLNAVPSSANPAPGFYDTVTYKGNPMVKYYQYNGSTVQADPEMGATTVAAPAQALVSITNSKSNTTLPYVVKSGAFWYFADLPFSYIGPRDRYLVLADMLHDILGVNHAEDHRGLVRFEDVGALVTVASMRTLTDYMFSKRIPFAIAAIPHYMDPLGAYNGGVAQSVPMSQASNLNRALTYAIPRGGQIVMHGYTHQYGNRKNPHTGVSGDDFEFWNIVQNTPVAEEGSSTAWAVARLRAGKQQMAAQGYAPFAWEAPHYQSSPMSIRAAKQEFAKTYQRVVYYTSDLPDLVGSASKPRDFAVGQFFPYFIKQDYYGQQIVPENLGNIEYNICSVDPSSCFDYTWQDLELNAKYALVVRDGFGSFFFHPFWLEPTLGTPGYADFQKLMNSMTTMGYRWVSPKDVTQ